MSAITIGTDAVPVDSLSMGARNILIQNLGPDSVFMDSTEDVSSSEGFEIAVGGVYETPGSAGYSSIYLVSSGTSNLRIVGI